MCRKNPGLMQCFAYCCLPVAEVMEAAVKITDKRKSRCRLCMVVLPSWFVHEFYLCSAAWSKRPCGRPACFCSAMGNSRGRPRAQSLSPRRRDRPDAVPGSVRDETCYGKCCGIGRTKLRRRRARTGASTVRSPGAFRERKIDGDMLLELTGGPLW